MQHFVDSIKCGVYEMDTSSVQLVLLHFQQSSMQTDSSSEDSGFEDSSEPQDKSRGEDTGGRPPPTALHITTDYAPPPSIPLSGFTHSLVPDMAFGWRPKLVHGGPIPLLFNKCELPVSIDPMTQEEFPVLYHGFRPRDTMVMHQAFEDKAAYAIPRMPAMDVYEFLHRRDQRLQDQRPFVGMSAATAQHALVFDSQFEGGNLDKVVQVGPAQYDLYMRVDANTRGYHQWYYFSVTASTPAEVTFNIVNFTKNESLYSQGMLPVVYSEKEAKKGWHRGGFDVKYRSSKINSLLEEHKSYFALTFSYKFEHALDKVYFAYAFPYTFSRLCTFLSSVCAEHSDILKRDTLCKSLSGVEVPYITITNFSLTCKKDQVVITSRQHPGESHGSLMLEVSTTQGLVRYLLSDLPEAKTLRDRVVFSIVPCLNPDGVIMGNYRTGFAGHDLNRQFGSPDFMLHPTVVALKKLLSKVHKDGKLLAFLDLHAHSRKKSVFIYGPYYPLHSAKYYTMRVLPRLICEQTTQFRYAACQFRNQTSRQQTARLVIWKEFRLANSYTVEGSFYGYLTEDRKTEPFTEETVMEAGAGIGKGMHQYILLLEVEARIREAKRKARRLKHSKPPVHEVPPPLLIPPNSETIEDVVKRIKAVEGQPQEAPAAGNDSSSEENLEEDELSAQDQAELHNQIASIVQEFSSLTRPRSRQYTAKAVRVRPRGIAGEKGTLDQSVDSQIEAAKRAARSALFPSKRHQRPRHVRPELKAYGTFIPLPRMAEYHISRSMSTCKKKRSGFILPSPSRGQLSHNDTRPSALTGIIDSFEERIQAFLKAKMPGHRKSASNEAEDGGVVRSPSFLITSKTPLAQLTPASKGKADARPFVVASLSKPLTSASLPRKLSTGTRGKQDCMR